MTIKPEWIAWKKGLDERVKEEHDRLNIDRFMANYGIAELERYRQAIRYAGFWDEFTAAWTELNGTTVADESSTHP